MTEADLPDPLVAPARRPRDEPARDDVCRPRRPRPTAGPSSRRATGARSACGRPTTGRCPSSCARRARSWAPSGSRGPTGAPTAPSTPRRGSSPRRGGGGSASRCGPPCSRWPSARCGPTRRSARPSSTTGRRSASRGPSATATRTARCSSTRGRRCSTCVSSARDVGRVGPGATTSSSTASPGPSPLRHRGGRVSAARRWPPRSTARARSCSTSTTPSSTRRRRWSWPAPRPRPRSGRTGPPSTAPWRSATTTTPSGGSRGTPPVTSPSTPCVPDGWPRSPRPSGSRFPTGPTAPSRRRTRRPSAAPSGSSPTCPACSPQPSGAGLPVALLTNSAHAPTRVKLEALDLAERFDVVVTTDTLGFGKPDPRVYLEACRLAGRSSPADVVCIGDSLEWDVLGAQAAGLRAVWLDRAGVGTTEPVASVRRPRRGRRGARPPIWATARGPVVFLIRFTPYRPRGGLGVKPLGVWCNWQHYGFWFRHSRFESWYPSSGSRQREPIRRNPAFTVRFLLVPSPLGTAHGPVV